MYFKSISIRAIIYRNYINTFAPQTNKIGVIIIIINIILHMNISKWKGLKQLFQDHKVSNMGFKPR